MKKAVWVIAFLSVLLFIVNANATTVNSTTIYIDYLDGEHVNTSYSSSSVSSDDGSDRVVNQITIYTSYYETDVVTQSCNLVESTTDWYWWDNEGGSGSSDD